MPNVVITPLLVIAMAPPSPPKPAPPVPPFEAALPPAPAVAAIGTCPTSAAHTADGGSTCAPIPAGTIASNRQRIYAERACARRRDVTDHW